MLGVPGPQLLVDREKAVRNIRRMQARATSSGAEWRPHFKTHQCAAIGEWFRAAGVRKINVSSLVMAEYFFAHGWRDIFIAFPVNCLAVDRLNALASACTLHLMVADEASLQVSLSNRLPQGSGTDCAPPPVLWVSALYSACLR